MKSIATSLFCVLTVLTSIFTAPAHAGFLEQLSADKRGKLIELLRMRYSKLESLGAKPHFSHRGHNSAHVATAADAARRSGRSASDGIISVPHFDAIASSGGQSYPLMFVGGNPLTDKPVAVKNVIIPIAITVPVYDVSFAPLGEITLDGGSKVSNIIQSPIYQPAPFNVDPRAGVTQWGDAMQRVTFFNSLKLPASNWHVFLDEPEVKPTIKISDFHDGFAINFGDGSPIFAFVAGEFIDGIIASYLATHHLPHDVVPIFVSYNALLFYGGDPFGGCCVLGYHDALVKEMKGQDLVMQTFMFADWNDAGVFSALIEDIHALSHEVSEWMNDPFVANVVPPYNNGETGCSVLLETGDQLVGNTVPVTINGFTYHPQTQDLLQYFTRESPSRALGGLYQFPVDPTVPNAPSTPCGP